MLSSTTPFVYLAAPGYFCNIRHVASPPSSKIWRGGGREREGEREGEGERERGEKEEVRERERERGEWYSYSFIVTISHFHLGALRHLSIHHQKSSSLSPLQANIGKPASAKAAATYTHTHTHTHTNIQHELLKGYWITSSCVEWTLHAHQRTEAPHAASVSINT